MIGVDNSNVKVENMLEKYLICVGVCRILAGRFNTLHEKNFYTFAIRGRARLLANQHPTDVLFRSVPDFSHLQNAKQ